MTLRSGRSWILAGLLLGCGLGPRAFALGWPDTEARVERGLRSANLDERRDAARALGRLSKTRATVLAQLALEDRDVEVKLLAADALLVTGAAPASGALAHWLTDAEPKVRERACRLLEHHPDPSLRAQLVRALGDPELDVRVAAATALGRAARAEAAGSPSAEDPYTALAGRIDDSSPELRVAVVRALGVLGDPRGLAVLAGRSRDPQAEVRSATAQALGRFDDARAGAALEPLLADRSEEVQMAALDSLSSQRLDGHVAALEPLLLDGREPLRRAALAVLERSSSPEAAALVARSAERVLARDPRSERSAWRQALRVHADRLGPSLRERLGRGDTMAELAAASLGDAARDKRGDAALGCVLARHLNERRLDETLLIEALGAAGGECALPSLLERLTRREARLRAAARRGLADYLATRPAGDGRTALPLRDALALPGLGPDETLETIALLGSSGSALAEAPLVRRLDAGDAPVREAAALALARLPAQHSSASDRPLLRALGAREPSVRRAAAQALATRGGPATLELLRRTLVDAPGGVDTELALYAHANITARLGDADGLRWLATQRKQLTGPPRDIAVAAWGRALAVRAATRSTEAAEKALSQAYAELEQAADQRAFLAGTSALVAAHPLALRLLDASDASVRGEAAAVLASLPVSLVPSAAETRALAPLLTGQDAAAINAAATLARRGSKDAAALCGLLGHARAEVRANALHGLARHALRCARADAVRSLLAGDPSALVRRAASRALLAAPGDADDALALERCRSDERDAEVAATCTSPQPTRAPSALRRPITIFFADASGQHLPPHGRFAVEYPDGVVRAGQADRSGGLFDPACPEGELRLVDHGQARPR